MTTEADARAKALIDLTKTVTARLLADCQAFEARRPQDVATSMPQTQALANQYRHESARIRTNPALLAEAAPAQRAGLLAATQAFEAMMARHARALAAAKTITEGLVEAIAKEVAATRLSGSGYGPKAAAPATNASAIALNRQA